ncbi:DNA/RNA non-specific endonuclease [Eubacterium sp. AB3007]|uniref:DNA/RNA non-specific endonuclease n=1 Tax=Eubacterium sp. AB3007 TaxID=1392487 RepID=UPI000489AC5E|nr:DNA/RNA non-specific endonuclease [Eubacterium sp. AB3007]
MNTAIIERLDKVKIDAPGFDRNEKMAILNSAFHSSLSLAKGVFGVTEIDKGNELIEKLSRNELGHVKKDYFQDGILTKSREKIADKAWKVTRYDDNGIAYLTETSVKGNGNTIVAHSFDLKPNTEIKKGNFSVKTDAMGRPISNKIVDLQICEGREPLSQHLRDDSYRVGDQRGHLIADIFGGPASKENIVPQLGEVNQSQFKRVENHIRELKEAGHTVDYEVKSNYVGKDRRPTSAEFKITVDGKPYKLDGELKRFRKIYNDDWDIKGKAVVTAKEGLTRIHNTVSPLQERVLPMHQRGFEQGKEAAKLTFAISTVDNAVQFASGEITADEMVANITEETAVAGAVGYGTGFISEGVAMGMRATGNEMIQSLAGTGVPTAVVLFGVQSYEDILDYSTGKIDGAELAYDLGDNAAQVAGGMVGMQYGAAIGTMVAPGVGTVAGGLVGGMVGCAVASGAYKTAVEIGSSTASELGNKAEQLAGQTIEYAKEYMPDSVGTVKAAINNFSASNSLPFSF